MSKELIIEFMNKLYIPDPPHALLLIGVSSAANWLVTLNLVERTSVFAFIENELSKEGDLPIKELLIKVLQQVGGNDSLKLIDKVITEGESIHGKYLILDAKNAKNKLVANRKI